jgi:hypothetical protein
MGGMINAGIFSLGDFTITTAGTQTGDWVEDLDGLAAMTTQIRLAYGSGGTDISAYLQTSLDQGTTAIDIACVTFGTAGATKVLANSAITTNSSITPTNGSAPDGTLLEGVLGDRVRLKIVSTGTYAGQTVLSGRIAAR